MPEAQPSRQPRSSALQQILASESWANERVLNWFRAAIWLGIGAVTGGSSLSTQGTLPLGPALALIWGAASAVSSLTWLRRTYRREIPFILTTADITVLAFCMDAGHQFLLKNDPSLVPHQIHGTGVVLMILLATNVLRFSWQLSLWSVLYGSAAYWFVLFINHQLDVLSYVEILMLAILAGMLIYAARKLSAIARQVVERDTLTRYLPAPVVERVARDPGALNLAGVAQEATVLFADIRGFTTMVEPLAPEQVIQLLNEYFAEMANEIASFGGIVMQFTGDGIYAVFPEEGMPDHPRRAVTCALGMMARLERLNARRADRNDPPLRVGIGLHTGPVVAGSVGSEVHLEYAYIGDTVNTASRIQGVTKALGKTLLVSETTFERAGGHARIECEPLPAVQLRGKSAPQVVWAVLRMREAGVRQPAAD